MGKTTSLRDAVQHLKALKAAQQASNPSDSGARAVNTPSAPGVVPNVGSGNEGAGSKVIENVNKLLEDAAGKVGDVTKEISDVSAPPKLEEMTTALKPLKDAAVQAKDVVVNKFAEVESKTDHTSAPQANMGEEGIPVQNADELTVLNTLKPESEKQQESLIDQKVSEVVHDAAVKLEEVKEGLKEIAKDTDVQKALENADQTNISAANVDEVGIPTQNADELTVLNTLKLESEKQQESIIDQKVGEVVHSAAVKLEEVKEGLKEIAAGTDVKKAFENADQTNISAANVDEVGIPAQNADELTVINTLKPESEKQQESIIDQKVGEGVHAVLEKAGEIKEGFQDIAAGTDVKKAVENANYTSPADAAVDENGIPLDPNNDYAVYSSIKAKAEAVSSPVAQPAVATAAKPSVWDSVKGFFGFGKAAAPVAVIEAKPVVATDAPKTVEKPVETAVQKISTEFHTGIDGQLEGVHSPNPDHPFTPDH